METYSKWDRFNPPKWAERELVTKAKDRVAISKVSQNHLYRAECGNDELGWNVVYVAAHSKGDATQKIHAFMTMGGVENVIKTRNLERIHLDIFEHST